MGKQYKDTLLLLQRLCCKKFFLRTLNEMNGASGQYIFSLGCLEEEDCWLEWQQNNYNFP